MKKVLKWGGIFLGLLLLLVIIFGTYINFSPLKTYENKAPDIQITTDSNAIADGYKIVNYVCAQCHRSKDGKLGGGLMEDSELGKIYAPNITQHPQYGISRYTDGEIAYLLRTGIKKNGDYAPPWMTKLPHLSDKEIGNIIAFLRSDHELVQPSDNNPPATQYSFLSKMIIKMGVFGPLPYPESPVTAPNPADKVAFGKYLALAKYDCYSCHSKDFAQVNLMEPEKTLGFFGGGNPLKDLEGNVVLSANLTMDKTTGIGNWKESDFVKALLTGITPDNRMVRSPMLPFSLLTETEAKAIWAYIKTVSIIENKELINRFGSKEPLTISQ